MLAWYRIIGFLFILGGCHSKVQYPFSALPSLTQAQMYEDYDSLVSIIQEVNPQLAVRKEVTGLDILHKLSKLRLEVDGSTTQQFYDIIRQALTLCQDGHAGVLPSFYFTADAEAIRVAYPDSLKEEAIHGTKIYSAYLDSLQDLKQLNLPIQYIDGKYRVARDFDYQDQTIRADTEIIQCNSQEIHRFVQSLTNQLSLRWDYESEQFYHENFLSAHNLILDRYVTLTFREKDGNKFKQKFDLYDSLLVAPKGEKQKEVCFFDNSQTLYIRVPVMNIQDTSFYINEISRYKNYSINKVVVDIRDNRGGSDLVGEQIIELLIDEWFYAEIILLARLSPIVADRLQQDLSIAEVIQVPSLDSAEYWKIGHFYKNVFPRPESIRHSGSIYILQNENIFSAAGTLAAYAEYNDQIISAGHPTGKLLGKGTTPFIFQLPNSQLLFRIEPLIDYSGVENAKDMFHDTVEMPLSRSSDSVEIDRVENDPMLEAIFYSKN
ncbi:MAG: S41 family peptidase [Bacteroidota bacterium]